MFRKYLELCTSHLKEETVFALTNQKIPYVTTYPYEEGLFVIVTDADTPDVITCPKDLESVFQYARKHSCAMIRFDRDAEELCDLKTYDW